MLSKCTRPVAFALIGGFVFTALLAACTASPNGGSGSTPDAGGGNTSKSSRAEQRNGGCPSQPQYITGTGAAGASCTTYADCAGVCCDCDNSNEQWLGAACVNGKCQQSACAITHSENMCPSDVIADAGTDAADAASSRDSASGDAQMGAALCTAGTSGSCYGNGMSWTGSQCCVSNATQCVDGTSSSCYGNGMRWTGATCCVEAVAQCVDGTSSSCYGNGKRWTGAKCCVEKSALCVDGTSSSCYGNGMNWTGAKCCVEGAGQCVDGTSSSCYGNGKRWTGAKCCL